MATDQTVVVRKSATSAQGGRNTAPPSGGEQTSHRRSRSVKGMGLKSRPAAVIGLCLAMLVLFIWGMSQANALGADSLAVRAALAPYLLGTPLVLYLMHRAYWRKMRTWLRRVAVGVFSLWIVICGLALFALM